MVDLDYLDDLDGEDLTLEIVRLAKTEGAKVALRSAMELCQDKKAPAQARASAQRAILQLAGLLDRRDRGSDLPRDLHEMNAEELREEAARLAERTRAIRARRDDDGIFN